MGWAPHVTVATIVEQDGRFLLVEEQTDDGPRFNQPAGHLERDESLIAAAARETLEETAYSVELSHLVGIYQWDHPSRDLAYLRFAFAGRILAHHPERPLDHGILRAVWLTPDEIRQQAPRHRSPLVLSCLEDHLAGRRHGLGLLHHVA
jgi:8-oxo-dGTP pyrophosphatase MutT (NUDIX family)